MLLENLLIVDAGAKGVSVARLEDGKVILVKNAVPGDIGDIQITKKRRKYIEGNLVTLKEASKDRINPKCKHFNVCGGCKWQHMSYTAQLKYKQNEVVNNFKKIAFVSEPESNTIIGSDKIYHYRNKMEFSFSAKKWLSLEEINSGVEILDKNALGLHIPGMWNKVVDLEECFLQESPSNEIRLAIKSYAIENNLSFYDLREKNGLLRTLMIRSSSTQELMVLIQFAEDNKEQISKLLNYLKVKFPQITSLLYTINKKENDVLYDLEIINFAGKDFISEKIENLTFKVGPKSFFQTNSDQAVVLYKKIRELVGEHKDKIAYDLYSGTGTITQFMANSFKQIIGIESVKEAVDAAKISAKENNINNVSFVCGDMKEILNDEFINQHGVPEIIITDPPRDGMHHNVIKNILNIKPQKIIYVSCNSATQARDFNLMKEEYKITLIQPVDMFPQTFHVENIIVLERILNS